MTASSVPPPSVPPAAARSLDPNIEALRRLIRRREEEGERAVLVVDPSARLGPDFLAAARRIAAAFVSPPKRPVRPEQLRAARRTLGLTQREAAPLCGVSAAYLSDLETGRRGLARTRWLCFLALRRVLKERR